MKQINYKKLIIPNIPYVFFVYLFDKVGQAVRLAPGADISEKILNITQGFSEAFSNALPSVHPLDLLIGIVGAAVAIGLPLFFLVKGSVGTSAAALCMVLAMLPMFLLAMYEKNGQPLEVIIRQFVEVKFLRPKERPYQTNNFYAALARQEQLDKEVRAIVKGKEKHPKRKA